MWRRRVTKTDYLIHLKELERSITKIMTQFGLYYEYSHQRERQKRRKTWSLQMEAVCVNLEEKRAAVETGLNEVIIDSMVL